MRRPLRWLGLTLIAVVLLGALGLGGGYLWLRGSLPQVDGEIVVTALRAPVTIVRDRWAIPHIEATSLLDASFALGFVHGQDRLWQMEFRRRLGAGRLAEILGAAALPSDRFMRTLGFYRLAEASLGHLDPGTVAWLQAYADGVNAFLQSRTGPLPPEFLILRHGELEPWRPADSLVWLRLMALDLATNYRDELARARLARRLSAEQIADIWPTYPESAPVTLVELARALPWDELAAVLPPDGPGGVGSNAWVVGPGRTTTGGALLANDPHLGLQAPGAWYLAHLETSGLELIGATLAGIPAMVLGHNGTIAWGFTNTGADTQDLFIERVDPEDPNRYLTPEGPAPFEVREERIQIAGAPPVALTVRVTRHGPVISDLLPDAAAFGRDRLVALAWSALTEDDLALQALLAVGKAQNWQQFVAALRDVGAPMQNIHYADTSGHIGFIAPGRVPIRRNGDGRWPVPGWTGEYDWQGWIPFEALPQTTDPAAGVLFNANNRIVPADYPYLITGDWEAPHRARRLAQLLESDAFGPADFTAMQADVLSLLAQDLLPIMLTAEPQGVGAAAAMTRLESWDRVMRAGAAEPLIFAAWYRELSRLIYADELRDMFDGFWHVRPQFMERILTRRQIWCDDVRTHPVETCAELATDALDAALLDLTRRFGDEPDAWRWGDAHVARMSHSIFADQPLLSLLFSIEVATGGDSVTVDVGHFNPATNGNRSPALTPRPIVPSTTWPLSTSPGSSLLPVSPATHCRATTTI